MARICAAVTGSRGGVSGKRTASAAMSSPPRTPHVLVAEHAVAAPAGRSDTRNVKLRPSRDRQPGDPRRVHPHPPRRHHRSHPPPQNDAPTVARTTLAHPHQTHPRPPTPQVCVGPLRNHPERHLDMTTLTMTNPAPYGFVHDLPEQEYHAHEGSLSVSGAKTLLKAPALFKWQQDHPVQKDVFDFGSAAHKMVLGVGANLAVYSGATDWRSKEARAFRDEARTNGDTPVREVDSERVQAMAAELKTHRLAMQLLTGGQPEVSAFALDEATGVLRRGRF